ncbi:MAG: GNAT family N-acetyltransferase [Deltaproteobacteria bacterium]|nr:GNAT family N-acetyltransferase [Deltaproteobacteria bacterium]
MKPVAIITFSLAILVSSSQEEVFARGQKNPSVIKKIARTCGRILRDLSISLKEAHLLSITPRLSLQLAGPRDEKIFKKAMKAGAFMVDVPQHPWINEYNLSRILWSDIRQGRSRAFKIFDRTNEAKLVGLGSIFTSIDEPDIGVVEILINKPFRSQGFAKEALDEMIRYAFEDLELEKLQFYTLSDDRGSLQLFENLEFVEAVPMDRRRSSSTITLELTRSRWKHIQEEHGIRFESFPMLDTYRGEQFNEFKARYFANRSAYKLSFKDGKIFRADGSLFDTTAGVGQSSYYYMDAKGDLYALPQHNETLDHHSSLTGGLRITCVGYIKVVNGELLGIDNDSGHYRPQDKQLLHVKRVLEEQGIKTKGKLFYFGRDETLRPQVRSRFAISISVRN